MTKRLVSRVQATFIGAGLALAVGGAWSYPALATSPPVVTDFPLPSANSILGSITTGPDGALWFTVGGTVTGPNAIGRIDPTLATNGTTNGITEFTIPTANSLPLAITAGPDGALWFVEGSGNKIGRIDPTTHTITEFPIPTATSEPFAIAAGPDGALWFTESFGNKIGRIDPTKAVAGTSNGITEFNIPTAGSDPLGITSGPDGALWFTEFQGSNIGRIDPTKAVAGTSMGITEFSVTTNSEPQGITTGQDGALWFAEQGDRKIGRIDPSSHGIIEFSMALTNPVSIISGPDGALWFTDEDANKIGRFVIASQTITEFTIPTANSFPDGITAGPDGALWFTEDNANKVGRITVPAGALTVSESDGGTGTVTSVPNGIVCGTTCTANFPVGSQVTLSAAAAAGSIFTGWSGGGCSGIEPCTVMLSADTALSANFVAETASDVALFAAILPASRSVAVGSTATVFATIINASADTAATNCTIQPATGIPANFLFQTTDPKTNALTGTANTPVMIAPGAAQSFVLELTPSAPINPTDVAFAFACSNANSTPTFPGINTLLLSAATPQPPDIVAVAATASKDGIVDIPGATGTGAFVVATANVGTSGAITASADTGGVSLPVTLTICQTDPNSGQCLAAPGASVATMINANATPTFAIFVQGSAAVPFSPAANRVFVLFKDASNTVRGETSVAVRTQ